MRSQHMMAVAACAVAATLATGMPAATIEMQDLAAADAAVVRDANGISNVNARSTAAGRSMEMWFEPTPTGATTAFRARGAGYTVRVLPASVELRWQEKAHAEDLAITLTLLGASPVAHLEPVGPPTGAAHYYIGNDASQWRDGVPMYQRVHSRSVYPGIDAVFYGNDRRLEYDFVVAPGANPAAITLAVEGPDHLHLDTSGHLVMRIGSRELTQPKPFLYQQVGETRHEIEGGWSLNGGGRVAFRVGDYDQSRPLVIDPVVIYSTYLGGSDGDAANGVAADTAGNTYVAGWTGSNDFPMLGGSSDPDAGNYDAFVAKFGPTGNALWITHLGGFGQDIAYGIAVHPRTGFIYVTGYTDAPNFPTTTGVLQQFDPNAPFSKGKLAGGAAVDAFVSVFHPSGTMAASTYLGHVGTLYPGGTYGQGIGVDERGRIYVSGITSADSFPRLNAYQETKPSTSTSHSAFLTALAPGATHLVYSTYFGGFREDEARVAVDAAGNATLAGLTYGGRFPTTPGAAQRSFGGSYDGYVARFSSSGRLLYSTLLGGAGDDVIFDVDVTWDDVLGAAYVTGGTTGGFPVTKGAFQQSHGGGSYTDAFVTELDARGALVYSTYLGGSANKYGLGIAVDVDGIAYVTGQRGGDFPLLAPLQVTGGYAFLAKLHPSGQSLLFSTTLGGSNLEAGHAVAVDGNGNAYVAGVTASSDFPVLNAFQASLNGLNTDAFVMKIDTTNATADLVITASASPNPVNLGSNATYTVVVTNNGPAMASNLELAYKGSSGQQLGGAVVTNGVSCTATSASSEVCRIRILAVGDSATLTISGSPTGIGPITLFAEVTAAEPDPTVPNSATASTSVVNSPAP